MLTLRKRVRNASTVISVFSEWPESLGPPSVLRRKLHLDSDSDNKRETFPFHGLSSSVCLLLRRVYSYLSSLMAQHAVQRGAVWRGVARRGARHALTFQRSLNSFGEASSDVRRPCARERELEPEVFIARSLGESLCPGPALADLRDSRRSVGARDHRDSFVCICVFNFYAIFQDRKK